MQGGEETLQKKGKNLTLARQPWMMCLLFLLSGITILQRKGNLIERIE